MTTVADRSYGERLLGLLRGRDALDVLDGSAIRVEAVARRLGARGLARSYGPGKWMGRQVLAHLADAELATGFRIRQILTEQTHVIQEWDESGWMTLHGDVDVEGTLATFVALRRANLRLFRALTPSQLVRVGTHPKRGDETLATTIDLLAGHTLNHLAQLESL